MASFICIPVPKVEVIFGSRNAGSIFASPAACESSIQALSPPLKRKYCALIGRPKASTVEHVSKRPLASFSKTVSAPSPPSEKGMHSGSQLASMLVMPAAMACATAWAVKLSLNESATINTCITRM